MKRFLTIAMALAMALSVAACGQSSSSSSQTTPEGETGTGAGKDYTQIILDARNDEFNEAYHIVSGTGTDGPMLSHNAWELSEEEAKSNAAMTVEMFGLDLETVQQYAFSMSMMNVKSYGIGIFLPAEGRTKDVVDMLNAFVASQQAAQQNYLADQYEIAKAAIVKELPSGEVILVMSEDAQNIASAMEAALK